MCRGFLPAGLDSIAPMLKSPGVPSSRRRGVGIGGAGNRGDTCSMMRAHDVIAAIEHLDAAGIPVWLDGGWGIDALVGAQTRDHDDLDVVIALDRAEDARAALAPLGYDLAIDERPTRLVLRAAGDRRVDVHTVTFDAAGGGIQRLHDGTPWCYPAEGFTGVGRVADRPVRCLTAAVQVLCHLGYEPDDADRRDMAILRDRCGVVLPLPYGTQGEWEPG